MRVTSIVFTLACTIATAVQAVTLGYDPTYGVGSNSLSIVACSNGANGLMTRGYTTFDSLPTFPYIASSSVVAGWNSPQCGSCWSLVYKDAKGVPKNITVTVVDHALNGFYTSPAAMDYLTGGHAVEYGVVDVTATMLTPVNCGFQF